MKEIKMHLSLEEQVNHLSARGLVISNHDDAIRIFSNINYYRLSGYLHSFKQVDSDNYIAGLCLHQIKRIYDFDRRFTRILLFALGDIEETLKTRISYLLSSTYPKYPLIYTMPQPYRDYDSYIQFLSHFYREVENNKNLPFVKHHTENYGGFLPIWVAIELLTMGNVHALFHNLCTPLQKRLARSYQTGPRQMQSWIQNLTYTRNHLAHCMRVFRFNFGRTPVSCDRHPMGVDPSHMIFDQIFIISRMYSDRAEWNTYVISEIQSIIDEYNDVVSLTDIGFPDNWLDILMLA